MNCPSKNKQDTEILLDYCDGTLRADRAAAFKAHAEGCPECTEWIRARRFLWQALDEWRAPEISSDFNARLYARMAAEDKRGTVSKLIAMLREQAAAAWKPVLLTSAACAGLTLGLIIGVPRGLRLIHEPTAQPSNIEAVETVEVEQIERALEDLELLSPAASAVGLDSPADPSPSGKM